MNAVVEPSATAAAVPCVTTPVTIAAELGRDLLLIPLRELRVSARNVRVGSRSSVAELAASIARHGLVQNLSVTPSHEPGCYDVVAGQRRLAAMQLLVKQRKLSKDHEVACLLIAEESARTVSLTENVQREAMHPADEFAAFAALAAEGRSIEEIAADFGVTPLVVRRRMKLANLSPRLLVDYRAGSIKLDQLMALAATDDHALQERAYYDAPAWSQHPQRLKAAVTQGEIDAAADPVARFVGLQVYQAAGGAVRRDLFSHDAQGAFVLDGDLLDRLAAARFAPIVSKVQAEGWGWVELSPRSSESELYRFRRQRHTRREPTKAERKHMSRLHEQRAALCERLDAFDVEKGDADHEGASGDTFQALQAGLDTVVDELATLEQALLDFPADQRGVAGAIVSLDRAGSVVVHRGLLKGDAPRPTKQADDLDTSDDAALSGAKQSTLSEALIRRLTAHRTAALQIELAREPRIALIALVHHLVERVLQPGYGAATLDIHARPVMHLGQYGDDVEQCPALAAMKAVRSSWGERLAVEPDALFSTLTALSDADLLELLAVCVASTVTAIAAIESPRLAVELAQALKLDMSHWWSATAQSYFRSVTKAKTLDAIGEFAPEQLQRLSKLKKDALAAEAEQLAQGTGWLPTALR